MNKTDGVNYAIENLTETICDEYDTSGGQYDWDTNEDCYSNWDCVIKHNNKNEAKDVE
jgi:hypothetical protein